MNGNARGIKVSHRYGGTLKLHIGEIIVDERLYSCPLTHTEILLKYKPNSIIHLIPNYA